MELTEQSFKDWLFSKPDDEVVGFKRDPYKCPVAKFIKEQLPCTHATVTKYWIIFPDKEEHKDIRSPKWMKALVNYVDDSDTKQITAKELKRHYAK